MLPWHLSSTCNHCGQVGILKKNPGKIAGEARKAQKAQKGSAEIPSMYNVGDSKLFFSKV